MRLFAIILLSQLMISAHCYPEEIPEEELWPEEQAEDADSDDFVADRDGHRGRDERRNLYEVNRDNVKRDAHEKARDLRKKKQLSMQQQQNSNWQGQQQQQQQQQPYYYYYPQ